jgi:hypothetical protein
MSDLQFSWPGRRAHDATHDRLAVFLVIDIQRSPDWAQDLLDKITDVKRGTRSSWERFGNAYHLSLSAAGARIADQVNPHSPPHVIPLDEFAAAVTAWMEAIA